MDDAKLPNGRLRHHRLMLGWTLQDVADKLYELCQQEKRKSGISYDTVGRWERGESVPSPHSQRHLCKLFGKSAIDLGFMESQEEPESPHQTTSSLPSSTRNVSSHPPQRVVVDDLPPRSLTRNQAFDMLCNTQDTMPAREQLGAWLVMGAGDLAQLFDLGWSVEDILGALQFVLRGVKAMHTFSRRHLFQLGAAALISGVPVLEGRHVSVEDRTQLCRALGENIGAGWKLFHTAGNAQVLAVSQAQLILVEHVSTYLYPSVRPMVYSGVYRLKGAALHFQGRYDEAYQALEKAYFTALEGTDVWNMAQSRSWQAYGLKEQGNFSDALQATDAALRLISQQDDRESIRLRARLLAFGAETAAVLGDEKHVKVRLDASEALLDSLSDPHEEFDRASWHQQAGNCALSLKQYDAAAKRLQRALNELPSQWTLRYVSTSVALVQALLHIRDLDGALACARRSLTAVKTAQAAVLTQKFAEMQQALLVHFPNEERCQTFVAEAQRQLASA